MTVRVAQITDIHLKAERDSQLYGVDTALSFIRVIDEIEKLSRKPDIIIATGDLAEDGARETYTRFRDLLVKLDIPTYVLPGNHDDVAAMRSVFDDGKIFFSSSAQVKKWGFLFVNSQVQGCSHGYVSSAEISKLEKNMVSLGKCPMLVSLHHTPSNMCPSSGCRLTNSEEFTALLNGYENVKGVIAGHTHNDREFSVGNHLQFTTPSTFAYATHAQPGESVNHEDFWSSHRFDGSRQGFRILDLYPEGTIRSEVRWLTTEE